MRVAFGAKAHSGWAALVVLGESDGTFAVVDRRRIALVERDADKQPYHAAERLAPEAARQVVTHRIAAAERCALQQIRSAIERERRQKHVVAGCAVLVGEPMPDWSVDEILAVHFRMHKAEGSLFRDVLIRAARACRLHLLTPREKRIAEEAERTTGLSSAHLVATLAALGKAAGPPWGKDQKDAALAALMVLKTL